MAISIQVVNFPKAREVQDIVTNRINECIDRFQGKILRVRAVFKRSGDVSQMKINVHGRHFNTSINATSKDFPHAVEKGLQKLENILRKLTEKVHHRRPHHFSKLSKAQYE